MNGLSTRKVKRSLKKILGARGLSHSTVGNITARVEEFDEWRKRDLSAMVVSRHGRHKARRPGRNA
jgi:transposase-like protein